MRFELTLNKKAINDIQKVKEYYNKQSDGLGLKFENALDQYLSTLETNPDFKIRYDNVRCLPIKKFPYMVHFSVNSQKRIIKIHAVLHTSRNPELWNK